MFKMQTDERMPIIQTERISITKMEPCDEKSFIEGISDQALRNGYGFPMEMDTEKSGRIFHRFCNMKNSYSLFEQENGDMIGFLLDVDLELPGEIADRISGNGRTIAYSIFVPFQRKGYMEEALRSYLQYVNADFIHCGHFEFNEASKCLLHKIGFSESAKHHAGDKIIIDEIFFKT